MLQVPYVEPVDRPVSAGVNVKISGWTPVNAQRFNVNLQCGPSTNPRDDVAFHLSADFYNQCLITNNIVENGWGYQQCDQHFPFQRGEEFSVDVSCKQSSFEVTVNNHHSVSFEHRIDPSRITHLAIDGDVVLYRIEYFGGLQGSFSESFIRQDSNAVGPIGFDVPPSQPYSSSVYSAPDPSRAHSHPNFHHYHEVAEEPHHNHHHAPIQYPGPHLPPVFPQHQAYPQQSNPPHHLRKHSAHKAPGKSKICAKDSSKACEKAAKRGLLPAAAGTGLGVYAVKGWFKKCTKSSDDSD